MQGVALSTCIRLSLVAQKHSISPKVRDHPVIRIISSPYTVGISGDGIRWLTPVVAMYPDAAVLPQVTIPTSLSPSLPHPTIRRPAPLLCS
jgi:hypothetical protein